MNEKNLGQLSAPFLSPDFHFSADHSLVVYQSSNFGIRLFELC